MKSRMIRSLREDAGLTQAELAAMAGVSRQLVGAVEAGRHLPRVNAALSLARALGVTAESLFGPDDRATDVLTGRVPDDGTPVRAGWVGDRMVTTPARVGADGWDAADGVIDTGRVVNLSGLGPGMVVVGCEPGLETIEVLLRQGGAGAIAVPGSSARALEALLGGRAHGAVVHGPVDGFQSPDPALGLHRFGLTRWQVGVALPDGIGEEWWARVVAGEVPVVQREAEAAAQQTFAGAIGVEVPGPRVGGHVAAARHGLAAGLPAVTIEPAARAVGAGFHPLGWHRAELWVGRQWLDDRGVEAALMVISGSRFRRRLETVGGYDLEAIGSRVA